MTDTSPRPLELWLPNLSRFDATHPLRVLLQRADRLDDGPKGFLAGLTSYFVCAGGLSAAALSRECLVGDAADATWLSADPAWVQPDFNGVRLLACGQMQLSMDDAQELARPLKPVFGDAGMILEVSSPDRWHLRLSPHSVLPEFAAPEQALGEDLLEHLPQGPDGRRWRVLINEVQVLLHQHPLNAQRRARGLQPVNSLWLWGGGKLPTRVGTSFTAVVSDDILLGALARRAGVSLQLRDIATVTDAKAGWLIDLQDLSVDAIDATWWPVVSILSQRRPVALTFASGERWSHRPWHRFRFWRRSGR